MAAVSYAHKPKLRAYIQSRGARAPVGYSKHREGHEKSGICVFCNDPHDNLELMIYPDSGISGAEGTATYMCSMCFAVVKEMESKLAGYGGMGAHYNSEGTQSRLDGFVTYGFFEQTIVARYFQHNTELMLQLEEMEMCYFCNNLVHDEYMLLDVPVSGGEYVDGGKIRCCFPCRDVLLTMVPEGHIGAFLENKGNSVEKCVTCGARYSISGPEKIHRDTYGLESYNCPNCMIKEMYRLKDETSTQADLYSLHMHEGRVQRFELTDCSFCEAPLDIDKMLLPSVVADKHISKWGDRVMCHGCADDGSGPIASVIYHHKIWLVYPTSAERVYIRRIKNSRGKVLDTRSVTGEIGKIILYAVDDIKNVTREGTQSKLKF